MKTRKSLYDDGFAQFENEESNPRKPTIRIQEKKIWMEDGNNCYK